MIHMIHMYICVNISLSLSIYIYIYCFTPASDMRSGGPRAARTPRRAARAACYYYHCCYCHYFNSVISFIVCVPIFLFIYLLLLL